MKAYKFDIRAYQLENTILV